MFFMPETHGVLEPEAPAELIDIKNTLKVNTNIFMEILVAATTPSIVFKYDFSVPPKIWFVDLDNMRHQVISCC